MGAALYLPDRRAVRLSAHFAARFGPASSAIDTLPGETAEVAARRIVNGALTEFVRRGILVRQKDLTFVSLASADRAISADGREIWKARGTQCHG